MIYLRKINCREFFRNEVNTKLNDITDLIQAKEKNLRFVYISCLLLQLAATPKKVFEFILSFNFSYFNILRLKMVFDQNNFVYQKLIVYLKFLAILLFQVRRTTFLFF
jgi:hypothetical protein